MKTARYTLTALVAATLALAALAGIPQAAPRGAPDLTRNLPDDPRLAPVKQVQRRAMLSRHMADLARARAAKKNHGVLPKGFAARTPRTDPLMPDETSEAARRAAQLAQGNAVFGTPALGANVRANDPSQAPDASNAGQAEASMAVLGNDILIAWNDGQGFNLASGDIQGYGWSNDGGATFTDGGIPPKPPGWTWGSDPVITLNERTGTFYYCALADSFNAFQTVSYDNGIIVVPATFSGGAPVWGTPRFAVRSPTTDIGFDKEWMVADSTNDSLYVIYTNFNGSSGSEINFVRSGNGTTWTPAVKLSSGGGDGLVHGARVATGPNGELYAIWSEIGPVDVDFFRIRRSTNAGATWSTEVTLPSYYANFGTGAPGFNRERGITFPAIAVDRSTGTYRGRLYVTWNECFNWYDDLAGGAGNVAEIEPNNTFPQATPFTLGNTLTGTISSVNPADADFFSFTGNQGDDVVLRINPSGGMDLAWRLLCSDGTTQLAISNLGKGAESYICFTLPSNGTYYVRPSPFTTSTTGSYTIHTKKSTPGAEPARDHRDVMLTTSSNLGQTWSTPVRVNGEPGYYDDWLPEVAVAGDGRPYVIWYDWRDTPPANCGGWSNVYLARSNDGGTSWGEVGLVTDTQTAWTTVASNIAPNQGDYLFLFADGYAAYPVWYDGRAGNPDVYTSVIPLASTPVTITLSSVIATPTQVSLTWSSSGAVDSVVTVYRHRPSEAYAPVATTAVPANGLIPYVDTDVVAGGHYFYRIGIDIGASERFSSETEVVVPVAEFALRSLTPNPASSDLTVSYALQTTEPASLTLYDIFGREVRRMDLPPVVGIASAQLLGGSAPPSGVYIVMLRQGGNTATTRVSIVK